MDWNTCLDKGVAKEIKPDEEMANSILSSSDNKIKSADLLETSKITAGSKLSLAYDALRGVLEALAIKHGYKIYNHECYTCFLEEVLKADKEATEFDGLRRIRNKVNYYGQEISVDESNLLVERIKSLRKIIIKQLLR